MSDLPHGWAETTIGEVVQPFVSIDPTKQPDTEFRYVDIGSIDKSTQTIGEPKTFMGLDAPSRARRVIHEGDVLFSTVRTYLKNIAAVPAELDGVLTSTGIAVLRASEAIDRRYLFNWVCSDEFVGKMSGAQDGTLYPAVTDKDVSGASVSLPPIPEQRRIVAKVDGLTARTARARKELDRIPTLIARYKQRLLALAFSGKLIGSEFEACEDKLASITLKLDQGWSPKCENFPSEDEELWAVIKTTAIQPVKFLEGENKQLPAHLDPRPKIEISAGEILVTRAGPRNRVGISCFVRRTRRRLMLADKVYRLRVDLARVDPLFVTYMLNSPDALDEIEGMKSGGSESGLNLTQDKFLSLRIPIPNLKEQAEIVRRIESAFGWLDRMATDHAAAARLLPKLDAAILTKAFQGKLVPQDPNDEPASVLLERIQAEREATPKEQRGRKVNLPPITGNAEITLKPVTLSATGTVGKAPTRARKDSMTKTRQDDDVTGKPYLAGLLKFGTFTDAQSLFRAADLPVSDFYKQLAWEIDNGHILDNTEELKAA